MRGSVRGMPGNRHSYRDCSKRGNVMSKQNEEFLAKCKTLTVDQLENLLKKGGLTKEQELICKTEINTILDRKKYNTEEEGASEMINSSTNSTVITSSKQDKGTAENEMALPKYYNLVRIVAQIGAVLGCISGAVVAFGGLPALKYGFMAGMTIIFWGVIIIVLSLAGLGVTYCFLATVKAQIESRNAIISYTKYRKEN